MENLKPKANKRRDFLREIEQKIQTQWDEQLVNQADAPADHSAMTFEEK